MEEPESLPQILTPSSSGRRRGGDSNSPEFEFWMVRNPSFPQPNLLSADELFSDGVLLPLQVLHLSNDIPTQTVEVGETSGSDRLIWNPESSSTADSAHLSASPAFTSSKRWRDIFKKNEKKSNSEIRGDENKGKEVNNVKEKKREKKTNSSGGGNGVSAAELNINIWPFSRSRSAGNGGTRPRPSAIPTRKVSSAPCSRSNSAGESKSRKWPSSPRRAAAGGGVPVGRTSPVWQARRSDDGLSRSSETVVRKGSNDGRRRISGAGGPKAKPFALNVPMCIGYRHHLGCRNDVNSATGNAARGGEGVHASNLFNIKSLFTKKVY